MNNKAILFLNLGSPNSPAVKDVRAYLNEFLMDKRVIDLPYLLRKILVQGIIVPLRAFSSAKKYLKIWTKEGSPLVYTTKRFSEEIENKLKLPCFFAMRYAQPSTKEVVKKILEENQDLTKLIVFPLYPHYAMSSYESAVEELIEVRTKYCPEVRLKIIPPFYNFPPYIAALANSIRPYLKQDFDHVLFSYHGIPERHVKKTDCTYSHCLQVKNCCELISPAHDFCYRHQVIETTKLVAKTLQLSENKFSFSFQSRLGRDAWLKPFTAQNFTEFPKKGIKKLLVISPAFLVDCLETLEEIHMEGKEVFLKNGGEYFEVVPCLNLNDDWQEAAIELINS